MKKSLLAILFGMAVLSFGAFNFTSCEVGLGAAVDVEAPTLVIESPKTSVIIRDAFAISGTWKDDGNIDELTVVLRDTTTDKKTSYTGTVVQNPESEEAEGSWSVIIDPVTEDIVDGSYEATVTISDKGGHSTVLTRSFVIDNTAPIIVLTRPSTAADSESSDTYGQTFTLEGQAADTNSVNLIEVEIYSDKACTPESYLHTVPLKNVPNSINMDVAKFEKGITDNDYYKIYKDATTDGGAKDFYCKVIAYDGAQRYPTDGSAPTEADKKGNATSNYYLYKDIATEILSEYKVNKVYEIFNGTFQDDGIARTITKESVIEKLSKNVRTEGRFTLNPKNNPTFAVTGRNPLLLDGTDFAGTSNNISDGSQVVIEVSPGLDGILINEKSLAVYAAECNASGSKTGEAIALDFTKEESGTSYRLITKIDKEKGLVIGNNYLLYVSGYDQATSPNPIEPVGKAYGFHMASSGRAPVLEITKPALVTDYTNKLKQTFEGSVTVEVGTPVVVINYNNKEYQLNTFTSSEKVGTDTKYYFKWETPEFENKNASHKFEFKGVLDTESQPVERTIVFDKDKPEINNLKIDEAKKFDGSKEDGSALNGRYINGTVNATIDITDSYDKIASASYKLIVNGDESATTEVAIADENLPKFAFPAINTKNYADGTSLTIKVTAKDRAGNEQVFSENFIVDQETDKPWIWPRLSDSTSLKVTTVSGVNEDTNTITAGSLFEVKIYDDDGTSASKLGISVKRSNKLTTEEPTQEQIIPEGGWSVQEYSLVDDVVSFRLPDAGGFYKYRVSVTDRANSVSRETLEFVVSAARAEATITNITKTPEYVRNDVGQKFTITIEGVSSQGPYRLFRRIGEDPNPNDEDELFEEIPVITTAQNNEPNSSADREDFPLHDIITIDGTLEEGTKVYYYVKDATPRNSNKGKFVALNFDDVAPEVTINTPGNDTVYTGINAISDSSMRFEGDIVEANSLSGVYYQIKANNGAHDETPSESESLDASKWSEKGFKAVTSYGTTSWKINQTFIEGTADDSSKPDALHEGQNYKLYVFAVDKAGNVSDVQSRVFDVDRNDPVITTKLITGTEEESLTNNTTKISTTSSFTFNYVTSDTYGLTASNGSSITVTKDGEAFTAYTDNTGNVTLNSGAADGLYTFTITANDKVGKSSTVTRNIRLDSTGPTINIATGLDGYQTSASVSVNGTAEDISGVDKVYYSFADTAVADLSDSTWHATTNPTTNATNWSFTMDDGTDGAVKKLHLCAVDKNGVKSAVITKEIKYDLANPLVTESGNASRTYNRSQTSFTLTGSVSDTNGIKSLTITDEENNTYSHNLTLSTTEPYSYTTSAPGTWTVTCPIGTSTETTNKVSDGTHTFTITATDAAGKTSTVKRTVIVDTELPTLTLSALPDKNEMLQSIHQSSIRGTASDGVNGSGIKKVELTISNAGGTTASVTKDASGTNSWMYLLDFTNEDWSSVFASQGSKKITLKVTDIAGNENTQFTFDEETSPVSEKTFIYDNAAPETVVTSSIGDYMKEAGITISGTVTDNYGFASLIVNEYQNNVKTSNSGKNITPASTTEKYEWSVPVPLRAANNEPVLAEEGNYKYEFIAKDEAGHETSITTKQIIVDKTPPKITSVKLDDENYGTKEWYSSNTIQLKVRASDPGTTGVSGIATVQYSTDNTTWANLSQKDDVYQAMVQFSDGTNNIWIRALDNADNTTYFDGTKNEAGTLINPNGTTIPTSVTIKVDTSAPTVKATYYQIGNNTPVAITESTETIYVNNASTEKVTFYGLYKDEDSGVKALTISGVTDASISITYSTDDSSYSATLPTDTTKVKSWKAEFTPTTEDSFKISVNGTNNANTSSKHEFTMIRDVTPPSVPTFTLEEVSGTGENAIYTPQYKDKDGNYFVNNKNSKKFRFSGTAGDKYGLAGVVLDVSSDIAGATKTGSNEDWAFTGFTIGKSDGEIASIKVSVTDNAGNTTPISLTIKVDTTAPVGVHAFDKKGKDLYFRVGEQNRDDGIISTNANGVVTSASPDWSEAIDKDVGGKYSSTTYGNSQTLRIRGNFDDNNGSDLAMIYYKIYSDSEPPAKTELDNLLKNKAYESSANGYFSSIKATGNQTVESQAKRRVFFSSDDGLLKNNLGQNVLSPDSITTNKIVITKTKEYLDTTKASKTEEETKYYTDISSTFSTTIQGLSENANNYLVLIAVDNVGNANYETIKLSETDSNPNYNYTINVDTLVPVATPKIQDKTYYVNSTKTNESITVWGTVTDARAGIADAVLKVSGEEVSTDLYINGEKTTITKIGDTAITGTSGESVGHISLITKGSVVLDAASGKYNIQYTKDNETIVIEKDVTGFEPGTQFTEQNAAWKVVLKNTACAGKSSGVMQITVKDKAGTGNKESYNIGSFVVDNTPPVINIQEVTNAGSVESIPQLNGKITISGNISETNLYEEVPNEKTLKLYYKKADTAEIPTDETIAEWTELNSVEHGASWSFTVDTRDSEFVDNTIYYFCVAASDKAGNNGYAIYKSKINQDSDRPVVKFTNLAREGEGTESSPYKYFLKYGTNARLEGSIKDDDSTSSAAVKQLIISSTEIQESNITQDTTTKDWTITGATGVTELKSSGDYTFTPSVTTDGSKDVYFYIVDNNNKLYCTKKTNSLDRPYLQYKDESATDKLIDADDALTYKSDSKPPVISNPKLQAWKNEDGTDDNDKVGTLTLLGDSCVVGGLIKNYVEISIISKDDNEIEKVELTLTGKKYDLDVNGEIQYDVVNEVNVPKVKNFETILKSTVSGDGEFKLVDYTDKTTSIFTTKRINIHDSENDYYLAEGTVNVQVKVYDKSGLDSNQETSFSVDRTPPSIDITTPSSDGVTYYGTIKQNVAAGIIGGGDVSKIYFKVSEDSTLTDFTDGVDISSASVNTASIVFDGNLSSTENGFHTKNLHDWIKDLRPTTKEQWQDYNIDENDDNVPLYVYYKAVDSCGNFKVEKRLINVIPNGDKPLVKIAYPENKNGATPALAGTIRLYGTTEIQAFSVDSVYIQIAPDYPESGTGYNWDNWETALAGVTSAYSVVDIPFSNNKRGIKASGTPDNWNLPINSGKEFDVQSGQRHMAIRVFAVSDSGTDEQGNRKGKVSDPVVQPFNVDITAPHIGGDDSDSSNRISLQLVQFETGKEGQLDKITSRAAYKSDMWVTGNWYLLASVWDDNGIKTITLDEHKNAGVKELVKAASAQAGVTTADSKTCYITATDKPTGAEATNFNICIPLPTGAANTSGSVTYTIEATENTNANLSSVETVKINYDNTPPKIGGSNYVLEAENMFANPKVYDEDGFYKLKGYVSDSGTNASGLLGVAFYFVRRGSKNCVYDPMYHQSNSVSIASAKLTTDTLANNDVVYANGLYWKHKTLQTRSDSLTEIKLAAADPNIHKGGLVMLGGKIYKITSLSTDGKTITLNDSAPKSITSADFALALLVDNRNTESQGGRSQNFEDNTAYGYGYYPYNANEDDGDLMLERLGGDVEGRWEASIYSKNIPDGPIEIHYVAFDKAQNYTVGIIGNVKSTDFEGYSTKDVLEAKNTLSAKAETVSTTSGNLISYYNYYYDSSRPASVSNNAPRVASVTVGVDYDNSNTIDDSERETEYVGRIVEVRGKTKSREITDKFDVAKIFTIKAKTEVGFEIVGGNGSLYYRYKMGNSDWQKNLNNSNEPIAMTVTPYSETVDSETFTEGKYLDDASGASYYNASTVAPIQIPLETINTLVTANTSNDSPSLWTIELWDSTEDTTVFTNSQFAQVNLKCNVQTRDNEVPNTVISPLYWNSSTDNSVYINSTTDKLEGHIELKKDLTDALRTAYDDGLATGDDKVSGKVVFRGYAWDNKLLKKLEWAIVGSNGKSILPAAASGVSYNEGAVFASGSWTNKGTLATDHWAFTVKIGKTTTFNTDGTEAYIDKKGHKVAWELVVDTSYISNITAKNAKLYVCATDAENKTTTMIAEATPAASVTDQEAKDRGTKKPTYQVDIVPYITGIKSRLSDNRSSNGVYQLADKETGVELIGYNLTQGNGNLAITTPTASSNDYSATVGGNPTINNMNNNDAVGNITDETEAGKVKNKYNYQPSSYNNSLTDDVKIQLWQFNSKAAQTNTGVGFIAEPAMAFNPVNGNLGFAFSNGANKFSMANGQSSSYTFWEWNYAKYVRNAIAYDESGRSHGISVGIDTEPSIGKAGRMNYFYSTWGTSQTDSSGGNFANNTNSLHIDTIGIPNANDYTSTSATNNDWGQTVIVEDRFKSTSMVAANHGTNNYPTVYIAYYDDILERIVFRWGTVNTTTVKHGNNDWRNDPNGYDNLITTIEGEHSFPLPDGKYSLIAGGTSVPDANGNTTALTPYNAGEYVDLGLVKGNTTAQDVVCVVWYDAKLGNLMYSYKINPCNQNFASTTYTSGHWAKAKVLKQNCGEYCKIAVDANGGVHIAAYDNGNKGVGYVYLPSYNAAYSEANNYYLIDAMNGPFDELGIDVAVDAVGANGKAYPTISYYANGTPKIATYTAGIKKSTDMPEASWENDSFTGKWDVCFVPTPSKLLKDHINVVQPKKTTGVRSAYGNATAAATGFSFTGTGATDSGKSCGNGTTNPILGYAIRNGSIGYLEIAQRK